MLCINLGAHHVHQTPNCTNLCTLGCLDFLTRGTNQGINIAKKCSGQLQEGVQQSLQQAIGLIPTPQVSLNLNIFMKMLEDNRKALKNNV